MRTENHGLISEAIVKKSRSVFFFGALVYFIFAIGSLMIDLLKLTGRFTEKNLESFPQNARGIVVVMNHQDGTLEWILVYRRFFRAKWLLPWLFPTFIRGLPFTLADRTNFYYNPLMQYVNLRMIPIDRREKKESSRSAVIRQCQRLLDKGENIIFFGEMGRTKNAKEYVLSPQKGKKLGRFTNGSGAIVEGRIVKGGWADYPGSHFSALPNDGRFSLRRFLFWYLITLIGLNGKIILVWGRAKKFEKQNGENGENNTRLNNTRLLESYLLELADV